MSVLLDTHALIWWLEGAKAFPQPLRVKVDAMAVGSVFFSSASIYEIELKRSLGKLPQFPDPVLRMVLKQGFTELPITANHAHMAAGFTLTHKDPWDRLIAAQAMLEGLTVLTRDPQIAAFGARTAW